MSEILGSIITCKHNIFNPKHINLAEKYPLKLTLNPKTLDPKP
jgi:hypothetical protein